MALPGRRETVTFRDVSIIFKNFAGEKRHFNAEGDRNFSILLGEKDAKNLERDGWKVKPLRRNEEDDRQLYHLKVKVNFANRPPRTWLVTSGGRTLLGEGLIAMLDQLDSMKVDLVITPYDWNISGNTGRTAYLESLYFHMYENELDREYADMPQIASAGDAAPKQLEVGQDFIEGEVVDDDEPYGR